MIVGLTGGMGCGKSTASRLFSELGFRLIDCDAIVREEVLTNPVVLAHLCAHYGASVAPCGLVDRAVLASKVFANPTELRWLEALVHPEVSKRWRARVATDPDAFWVVEVPLLFEKDLYKLFDFVVCVACAAPSQLARLEKRGVSRELAEQRIAQQLPLSRKVDLSDFVLSNDGSPEFLKSQVTCLASRLMSEPRANFNKNPV